MASLYIKDSNMAARADRFAKRLGTTKTDVVRQAFDALEEKLGPEQPKQDWIEWMNQYRRDHPLPPPTGLKVDKAFFDWLSGEEGVDDSFR